MATDRRGGDWPRARCAAGPSVIASKSGVATARRSRPLRQHGRVTEFELPSRLVAGLAHEDADSPRRAWVAALPDVVVELAARWSLEVGLPFQPGGQVSWVAPVRTSTGEPAVLKVGWRHYEALHEADGLRAWGGAGAVRLIDTERYEQTDVLLLETCEPGTSLSATLPPEEQDAVIAGLLGRLWITPPDGAPFRPLQSMCDAWADEFERRYELQGTDVLDPEIARAGVERFRALAAPSTSDVLLCTDLHAENVLAAQREPWLVVDPKPYVGDRTYDVLQHMLNCPDRLLADAAGFIAREADLTGVDAARLREWLFARCVVESLSGDLQGTLEAARALASKIG